jgi:uncharacterized protein (TIGR02611 family)
MEQYPQTGIGQSVQHDRATAAAVSDGRGQIQIPQPPPPRGFRRRIDGVQARLKAFRYSIENRPTLRRAWRAGITVVGLAVLGLGILAIPYPGPGWLIVFAGLAILATEFIWAKHLLHYGRGKYEAWTDSLGRQSRLVRILVLAATALIVVITLWLLNTFWLMASWVGLTPWTWLQSPVLG